MFEHNLLPAEVCVALESAIMIATVGVQLNTHKLTILANEAARVPGCSTL